MNTNQQITHMSFLILEGCYLTGTPDICTSIYSRILKKWSIFLRISRLIPGIFSRIKAGLLPKPLKSWSQAHPQYTAQIQAYFDRWVEMISGEVAGVPDVLLALDKAGLSFIWAY